MTRVSGPKVNAAIRFMFPNLGNNTKAYRAICEFIHEEFEKLHTVVLYFRNNSFINLITEYGLEIGKKEVIITSKSVLASEHYTIRPEVIYSSRY